MLGHTEVEGRRSTRPRLDQLRSRTMTSASCSVISIWSATGCSTDSTYPGATVWSCRMAPPSGPFETAVQKKGGPAADVDAASPTSGTAGARGSTSGPVRRVARRSPGHVPHPRRAGGLQRHLGLGHCPPSGARGRSPAGRRRPDRRSRTLHRRRLRRNGFDAVRVRWPFRRGTGGAFEYRTSHTAKDAPPVLGPPPSPPPDPSGLPPGEALMRATSWLPWGSLRSPAGATGRKALAGIGGQRR